MIGKRFPSFGLASVCPMPFAPPSFALPSPALPSFGPPARRMPRLSVSARSRSTRRMPANASWGSRLLVGTSFGVLLGVVLSPLLTDCTRARWGSFRASLPSDLHRSNPMLLAPPSFGLSARRIPRPSVSARCGSARSRSANSSWRGRLLVGASFGVILSPSLSGELRPLRFVLRLPSFGSASV